MVKLLSQHVVRSYFWSPTLLVEGLSVAVYVYACFEIDCHFSIDLSRSELRYEPNLVSCCASTLRSKGWKTTHTHTHVPISEMRLRAA